MKLQFKHQRFQADAAKAVVDIFVGQPYSTPTYLIDKGTHKHKLDYNQTNTQLSMLDDKEEKTDSLGWNNQKVILELNDKIILDRIQKKQRENQIQPSNNLEGKYNLTIEMETGVGKTYTYIKTMFELNKHYGWTKFIVVVPSIAIREGVYKTFQITEDHFAEEYGKRIKYFIYNSTRLKDIDEFASNSGINVMIINSQAFSASGKDARRIYMELDEFNSRKPIDIISKTNPILIIDEPQSVEGKTTKEALKRFNPLMTLRYSATHKKDSIYNMIYRLDAMEAYNKRLVKKISVKGITEIGNSATDSYLYLEGINLSKSAPTAMLQFDCKGANGIRKVTRKVSEGYNLYDNSNEMEEYKNGFVVSKIDGRDSSVEFVNGIKIYAGDVVGRVTEEQLRRIQIRETILSHIEKERELFHKGIKVLSLFFIDEVAKYKKYDENGEAKNAIYAEIFEEEYNEIIKNFQIRIEEEDYLEYLGLISAESTHSGYFAVDKKGKMIDSSNSERKKQTSSEDVDAYELIMKNKELLLDRNPHKSPVRFIFSHSALKEGWDNPNVFQICTLKQSTSETRKRQEVGRGLRICVNQDGDRMDANMLGNDVHNVNVLTVIASESYDSFAKGLQSELAEAVADRPTEVTKELFLGRVVKDVYGNEHNIDEDLAEAIIYDLIGNKYIDKKGVLTDKYYEDKSSGTLKIAEEAKDYYESIVEIIDSVYNSRLLKPEDGRNDNAEIEIDKEKLSMKEFKELWSKINSKSIYTVDFDTDELVEKAIATLDRKLNVSKIFFKVEMGSMKEIASKDALTSGQAFVKETAENIKVSGAINSKIKYDLIGKLVDGTGLTRKTIVKILKGIKEATFNQFKENPEEFILKATSLIEDEKATVIIEHITYNIIDEKYDTNLFTDSTLKGKLGSNVMKTHKHLYNHLKYDSVIEKDFAEELDTNKDVAVYVKLPNTFFINTPVGKYNPDWAIAYYEGNVKHIFFVAETKGSMDSMQLRMVEQSKIHCARKHFKAISNGEVVYDVVDSYQSLLDKVMK